MLNKWKKNKLRYDINLVSPKWQEKPLSAISAGFKFTFLLFSFILMCLSFSFFIYSAIGTFRTIQDENKKLGQYQIEINNQSEFQNHTDLAALASLYNIHLKKLEWAGRIKLIFNKLPAGFSVSGLTCEKRYIEIKGAFTTPEGQSPLSSIRNYLNQIKDTSFSGDFFSSLELMELRQANKNSSRQFVFTLRAVNSI